MAAPEPEKAVSNSFDYVPVRPLEGFVLDAACCSARELRLSVVNSSRFVIVKMADITDTSAPARTVLCRTETGDFAEPEIRFIVHERGQLYLDVSRKPSISDFATDVRQLVLSDHCRVCPDLPTCCCCYVPAARSYFNEDEHWLAGLMQSLKGRVLDVGLGNVPYLRWADQIAEYHGVDPDPEAAAAVAANIFLHNVTIEDFTGFEGFFDTVLSLRSLNHFISVSDALLSIHRALKPAGQAVFIESLALPLVRSSRHAQDCHDEAAGGFQHLRNWDSSQLIELALKSGFDVTFHRPISRETCDQWIVVLTKQGR
jgi:hypothetical protein